MSDRSGYLEVVNYKDIVRKLSDINTKLVIREDIGSFIAKGQRIETLYYNETESEEDLNEDKDNNIDGKDIGDKTKYREQLRDKILSEMIIQEERIAYTDYRFFLQKIIDIILREYLLE